MTNTSLEAAPPSVLRDIKGPVSLGFDPGGLLFLALILLLLTTAAFLWLFFWRKKKTRVVLPAKLAHEVAYERLRILEEKDFIRFGKFKEYYSEISDIARRYLEDRFFLRAPEMTTEEFLIHLRDVGNLLKEHKALLKGFLEDCDMVKFARHEPAAADMEAIFASAKKLVDETREVVRS